MKLRFTVRKARILLKTFYWNSERLLGKRDFSKDIYIFKNNHSKKPLGKRGPRVLRPTNSALNSRGGKTNVFSPSWLPFFLPQTVGPRSHLWWGRLRAAGQIPALSASMAFFYLLDLILNASMGQIRRLGGRKARPKRQINSIRWFY